MKQLKRNDEMVTSKITKIREEAQQYVLVVLCKLFERSPLASGLLRSVSISNLTIICDLNKQTL